MLNKFFLLAILLICTSLFADDDDLTMDVEFLPSTCSGPVCTAQLSCAGVCVDPKTDNLNCGACGNICAPNQVCVLGGCRYKAALRLYPQGDIRSIILRDGLDPIATFDSWSTPTRQLNDVPPQTVYLSPGAHYLNFLPTGGPTVCLKRANENGCNPPAICSPSGQLSRTYVVPDPSLTPVVDEWQLIGATSIDVFHCTPTPSPSPSPSPTPIPIPSRRPRDI